MKTISFSDSSMKVNIVGNFGVYQAAMNPNFYQTGTWYDYFSGDSINVTNLQASISLNPGEFHIYTSVKLPLPDMSITTGIKDSQPIAVKLFKLEQNYPNPFNPTTTIRYSIANVETGHAPSLHTQVTLKIYDILGREITTLVNELKPAGNYEVSFDAAKFNLASGVYFYQLRTGNFVESRKMLYLK